MDPVKISQVKHLYEVEHLSMRQIAKEMRMCTKTISRIVTGKEQQKKPRKATLTGPYMRLIEEWYARRPSLKATQVYERLKEYGYTGRYTMVAAATKPFRKKGRAVYHEIEFLPGECAQVDWMEASLPFGRVYGFVFILAWSRYLFVRFYPRSSMEFFLAGHNDAYGEIKGAARRNWYDNLKSVVTRREPEIIFNAQFTDYMRHMGITVHACNPGKGNEKGRVERAIRDIRSFVESNDFTDIRDLNEKTDRWRREWNVRTHRTTHTAPASMLTNERLLPLPVISYKPYRIIQVMISTTAFVEFDTNRYSVPTDYAATAASVLAYPDHLEIVVHDRKIAYHARSFGKYQKIEHPAHRQKLLDRTPQAKYERINHLMTRMGSEIDHFLTVTESKGEDRLGIAYRLFCLLKFSSKEMLLSVVREAVSHQHTIRFIEDTLAPRFFDRTAVYPQNTSLLDISYDRRELSDYDSLA